MGVCGQTVGKGLILVGKENYIIFFTFEWHYRQMCFLSLLRLC